MGFGVKGALILTEKSGVLVEAASIAANSSSIGTELQNRLKQQRLKGIGTFVIVRRSSRTRYQELLDLLFEWRDVERQEASVELR